MSRGALQRLIEKFLAEGGAIKRVPDQEVAIDWSARRFDPRIGVPRFGAPKQRDRRAA